MSKDLFKPKISDKSYQLAAKKQNKTKQIQPVTLSKNNYQEIAKNADLEILKPKKVPMTTDQLADKHAKMKKVRDVTNRLFKKTFKKLDEVEDYEPIDIKGFQTERNHASSKLIKEDNDNALYKVHSISKPVNLQNNYTSV